VRPLLSLLLILSSWPLAAQRDLDRYALILEEPPLAAQVASRKELRATAAVEASQKIAAAQQSLRRELARRKINVTGAVNTILNAVFVGASREQAGQLASLPGVQRVAYMPPLRRHLDGAVALVNAPQAWNVVGGFENAGAGVKIGIIDSGIDQDHPAFRDNSLQMPPGYPKCQQSAGECAYTNNKVIVARSYVDMLVLGDQPAYSRPDDTSPRDRVGHGTAAAMIAAGVRNSGPSATITGVAPKAWLGNYKVFGSPGVNDTTFYDVIVKALEDAYSDGMDIVTLSLGSPAVYGPLDQGAVCGETGTNACDVRAQAIENASKGMAVVVSAGNDGDVGVLFPTLNSIHTPGTAPAGITVGASTNSHRWFSSVRVSGNDVPANLRNIPARFGNGPKPNGPLTAPLRDVSQLQDDGRACSPLANGSLAGAIALIQRGNCAFATKVNNAQDAGAVGVVFYQVDGQDDVFAPSFLTETGIPAVLIGNTDGRNLKSFLQSSADRAVSLDPALAATKAQYDTVASFSSRGPSIDGNIKPELVAVGTDLYTAVQRYDPNGELYDPSGYTATQGTSFAVPMVAGALAMVKQQNASFTPAQLKSAVVNTASATIQDGSEPARVTAVGAGKLNAEAAVRTKVTAEPATLSFGIVTPGALPMSRSLKITNGSTSAVTLAVAARDADRNARLTPSTSTVNAGQSITVAVRLEGSLPAPGSYEGAITIQGSGTDLRVPYLYQVGDGVAYNIFPVLGFEFVGNVGERIPGNFIGFKLIDRSGVPVKDASVRFRATVGGGSIEEADPQTDKYGIAAARVFLGPQIGDQEFTAEAGGLTAYFDGRGRLSPTIETNGVVNAASFERGKAVAPGSYIAIFGQGLSESTRIFSTPYLPLSLAGVSVSFDVPSKGLSLPGRLHFVSDGQVNVQAPWELQGLTSVFMKVSIGDSSSAVYTAPLADYSPALFEYQDSSGRQLIAALDENYRLIDSNNAARRGRPVQLYANGLGPVENQPATGEATPAQPLARTRVTPTVTVGGRTAEVQFCGLAPYNVGLYQINVVVPADVATGIQPVIVSVGGVVSKTANLPIQ